MVPNDLTGFSVEQLRGFATAVRLQIDEVKPQAKGDAEKLNTLEGLLDERDRLNTAIDAALAADAGEAEAEAAVAADAEPVTEVATEEAASTEVAATEEDPEAKVDEAVASAQMGGGQGPRVVREPTRSNRGDIRKFVQGMQGRVTAPVRNSFATINRETNHRINGGNASAELVAAAVADRLSGADKTAAGCFCGPDDARNEICEALVTDRPFSDTLPSATVNGDFRFIRQIDLADALTGVTEWTCADQALVDPEDIATWKPCFELDCEAEVTSDTYAVPACATFTTQQLIGNPVLIDNLQHVMEVAYNKTAELLAYNRVVAQASQYNYGQVLTGYGASAQTLGAVGWALELIRRKFRDTKGYYLTLPAGIRERILADGQIRGMDDYRTWNDFLERVTALGVDRVVELIDEIGTPAAAIVAPGGPPVAAPQHPNLNQVLLYRPDNFLLGLNPEVDLGVTRSPELARQNKLQWFTESFESVTRICIDPTIALNVNLCQSGIRPALGTGTACADGPDYEV